MHLVIMIASIGVLLNQASANGAILSSRNLDDPVRDYLERMCSPAFAHSSPADLMSSLANSTFPCDQQVYIGNICAANGTKEVDFLAEQECLCNGSFWEVFIGCDNCFRVHGYSNLTVEEDNSYWASVSTAECSPSPPVQPFSNLFPAVNITAVFLSLSVSPNITLGDDRFPNNTAISNYFTATGSGSLTAGAITGSATARLTTFTNFSGIRYTPTSTLAASATGSKGSGTSTSSAAKSSVSTSVGSKNGVKIASGIFAAGLSVMALL